MSDVWQPVNISWILTYDQFPGPSIHLSPQLLRLEGDAWVCWNSLEEKREPQENPCTQGEPAWQHDSTKKNFHFDSFQLKNTDKITFWL